MDTILSSGNVTAGIPDVAKKCKKTWHIAGGQYQRWNRRNPSHRNLALCNICINGTASHTKAVFATRAYIRY